MSFLVLLLIGAVFNAVILAALPFVKYKNFFSCLSTAALAAVIAIPVNFLGGFVAKITALLLWFIPFFGPALINPIVQLILLWTMSAISLYAADQIIEDFEIPTMGQTFQAALLLGIAQLVAGVIIGLLFVV